MESMLEDWLFVSGRSVPWYWMYAMTVGAFLGLYAMACLLGEWSRRRLLPGLGAGAALDRRPIPPGQRRREVRKSLVSIVIFGVLGPLTLMAVHRGWLPVQWHAPTWVILVDIVVITLWNEIHFYFCHRWLHVPWFFKRIHVEHHHSVVPTPCSVYAFHWLEALLLGSVMLVGMLLYRFHIIAILLLPVISITLNVLGHLNYDLAPNSGDNHILAMGRRHGRHHARVHGNFGFAIPAMDIMFGTAFDAAKTRSWPAPITNGLSKYLVGSLVLVAACFAYYATNHWHLRAPIVMQPQAIDLAIPVIDWTIWVYASYPLLFLVVFVAERDLRAVNHFMCAVLVIHFVSQTVFVLFPTTIDRGLWQNLASDSSGGATGQLWAWVHSLDTPANCLPSLHVSTSVLSALVLYNRRPLLFAAAGLWALAIAVSTLTTKQHYLIDVLSGTGLAVVAYLWVWRDDAIASLGGGRKGERHRNR